MILIAGPCVIDDKTEAIAAELAAIMNDFDGFDFYFKASFDKANRTSISNYRGPGVQEGLDRLAKIRYRHGFKTTTDVHTEWQAERAAQFVDMVQIPALLCRQTDILTAAGSCAEYVNIKKGQFMAPEDMQHAVEKVKVSGCKKVMVTERGASFGYHRLVVDFLSLPILKRLGCPVILDVTHSLQLPSAGFGCSASQPREYAQTLALAATAAGVDGLFFEVYPCPEQAKCDGPNSIELKEFPKLLKKIEVVKNAVRWEEKR